MSPSEVAKRIRNRAAALAEHPLTPHPVERFLKDAELRRRRKPGLPDVITAEELDSLCRRQWRKPLAATWHAPISSWKGSSAAFLWLHLEGGHTERVILKATLYSEDHNRASEDFPLRPGAPEFWIYGTAAPVLRQYLADCLFVIRRSGARSFVYVLEDLTVKYGKPPRTGGWQPGVLRMHDLHAALGEAAATHGSESLLNYDGSFGQELMDYAQNAIARFRDTANSSVAREVVDDWSRLSGCYLSAEFDTPQLYRPIHGDYNTGNLFYSRGESGQLKVVDWEWAGIGLPHLDLASYLRDAPPEVTKWAIEDLARREPDLSVRTHERLLLRCSLERAVWDASLLANQLRLDFNRFQRLGQGVTRSLSSAMVALNALAG
ncbi:MAG: phosphotransferase [Acidimicrobiia bacterium]